MGIKDNFSQAVKELWKKDGQEGEVPQNMGKEPSELDKYLRDQNNGGQTAPVQTPVQGAELNSSGVPLETPYYPGANNDASAQNVQNNVQPAPAQNTTNTDYQAEQPVNRNVNAMGGNNVNQMNSQSSDSTTYAQSTHNDGYNQNNYNQSAYNQGGYSQNMVGRGNIGNMGGGGRFVPPPSGNGVSPAPMGNEVEETTVISKNTQIEGNVRSLANMTVDGNIKGNLETTRNVDMTGKIVGDITANNASLNSAAMQGNVSLKGRMKMDRDTILIGDLSSQYADINGRIRGKLDIVGKAELKRDAIVFGDINASTIAVTDGAIIQGYVNTTFLSKDDSRNVFPDAISIEEQKQGVKTGNNPNMGGDNSDPTV